MLPLPVRVLLESTIKLTKLPLLAIEPLTLLVFRVLMIPPLSLVRFPVIVPFERLSSVAPLLFVKSPSSVPPIQSVVRVLMRFPIIVPSLVMVFTELAPAVSVRVRVPLLSIVN